ncbi:putative uncharacterized protein [Clostridium sp. CAG:590]|nr:putative uncharacterized protein [Clostridium sp. CAG:590]
MQIGQRFVTGYENNVSEQIRTRQGADVEQSAVGKLSADISALKEGEVFRGEILDIVGDKVTISLEDQAKLMARLQAGVELGVGDRLLFSVKENTANQVVIKPVFDSLYSAQTQVLEKALDLAGLSPTEKNFTVAKELMDAGMPVDKSSMVTILSQSMRFEGTSLQTLVSMNKLQIPVTAENITQFGRYENLQHSLTGDIAATAESVADFASAFPQGTDGQTMLQIAGTISELFAPQTESMDAEQGQSAIADMTENMTDTAESDIPHDMASDTEDAAHIMKNTMTSGQPAITETVTGTNDRIMNKMIASFVGKAETNLSEEQFQTIAKALTQAGVPETEVSRLFQNASSEGNLFQNMLHTLQTGSLPDAVMQNLFQDASLKDLMSEIVKKAFSVDPKKMKDPKEIDDLYETILKNTKSFEDAVASHGGNTKGFQQSFQNMRQNMQFMEQLNHQMIYAQMPVRLSNKQTNSELYVYADKRKLQQKKDGISVMLHLDMDHLGATDVKVTLTGSNVHARFYLNDQDSVDIVADNMNTLAKQLADRGFSLTNEVVKRQPQESINKVVDEVIDENAEKSIRRYTFDART